MTGQLHALLYVGDNQIFPINRTNIASFVYFYIVK